MSYQDEPICELQGLEPRVLMTAAPSAGFAPQSEWLDLPATGSVMIDGRIDGGDAAMYAFTAPARGRLTVEMNGTDGVLDSALAVYDSQGGLVGRNNNVAQGRLDSRLRLAVQSGLTYYIRAGGVEGTEGAYQLRVTNVPRDDCGDDADSARRLSAQRSGRGRADGVVNYAGDVDVWSLTARKSGVMTVAVSATGRKSPLRPGVTVVDATGAVLASDSGGDARRTVVTFDAVAAQTYSIRAAGANDSQGQYRLSYRIDNPAPEPEPNPSPEPNPNPELEPADEVTGQLAMIGEALQLLVLGTTGADTITLSAVAGGVMLAWGQGSEVFSGAIEAISVYGFAGADVIRLADSISLGGWVYGGDGADRLFDSGSGAAVLDGGDGEDLLVSVGGGADELIGGAGLDSFWFDTADAVSDAAADETDAKALHSIGEFYQPWTADSQASDYVSLDIAGQDLRDPSYTSRAGGYANFAHVPLFADGPQYNDIRQGGVGDCYYLASLAGFALTDPEVIRQFIAPLGDGTYAVRFFQNDQEVFLRLDADLPVSSGTSLAYAKLGVDGELWVPLAEKAYAFFRRGENSYASLSSGWMTTVYREITNEQTSLQWTSSKTADQLYDRIATDLAAGHTITLGSKSGGVGPIVGGHAYTVVAASIEDGQRYVTVYNPWGYDGRSYDDNYGDGLMKLSADLVKDAFTAVCICLV